MTRSSGAAHGEARTSVNEEQAIELAYTVADLLAAAVRPVTDTGSRNPSNHETPPGTG
ncbi:hypothetical protein [Streptomyces malaysiensis]|uniref:hypothetical protein n=1 Tax=Streptomyces malaysiensis TaxID=92644 RepID=UPI00322091CC|nr:hypothetical protein [Streptomyces malaysiensis]